LTDRIKPIASAATVRKKFDRNLYNKTNTKAIRAGVSYLKSQDHSILDKKETYGPDIISEKNGVLHYTEVETKLVWSGDWPVTWEDVRIPERKSRLIALAKSKNASLNFFIFNKEYTKAWQIRGDVVASCPLKEIPNRYVSKGEFFFIIPINRAAMIKLK